MFVSDKHIVVIQVYQYLFGINKIHISYTTKSYSFHSASQNVHFRIPCDAGFGSTYKTKRLTNRKYNSDNQHDVIILKTYKVSTKEHAKMTCTNNDGIAL